MNLFDRIVSQENIYKAIYSLESYITEVNLMTDDDIALYHRLRDKFDFDGEIAETIVQCNQRLQEILENDNELFTADVYFKIKNYDEVKDTITFRPMHTASLIDQICMVAMLMPLMFDDSDGTRKASALTQMIPHNFYGNIPSTSVDRLFIKWSKKYKQYSQVIIDKAHEYSQTREYDQVLTLDLKDFFPSVDPIKLLGFIKSKLSPHFAENDLNALETVLTKLLFFNIREDNVKGWEQVYYGDVCDELPDGYYMTKGIPQGLPQSYFFGNLCMVSIYGKMLENKQLGNAKYFFYVDDSVIFTKGINCNSLDNVIGDLNSSLRSCLECNEEVIPRLTGEQKAFQSKMKYDMVFHTEGKSELCSINSYIEDFRSLQNIQRPVSMGGWFNSSIDEIDERVSLKKLKAFEEFVNKLINNTNDPTRRKWLCRYRRYFIFRSRKLKLDSIGNVDEGYLEEFYKRMHINERNLKPDTLTKIFQTFEEEIFKTEIELMLRHLPEMQAANFRSDIKDFEEALANYNNSQIKSHKHLYYRQISEASDISRMEYDEYLSLRRHVRCSTLSSKAEELISQLSNSQICIDNIISEKYQYAEFILNNSEEFKRKILNTCFSIACNIPVNDSISIFKNSIKSVSYSELRITAWLRNRRFNTKDFFNFLKSIDPKDTNEKKSIDICILEALGIFQQRVLDAKKVDLLIQTHRVVKSLWHNGSKFLNAYTLHNEEHAIALIRNVVRIVNTVDYLNLKSNDYFLLFQACYLHDISMVIHPRLTSFNESDTQSNVLISQWGLKMAQASREISMLMTSDDIDFERISDARKHIGHMLVGIFEDIYSYFDNKVRANHGSDSASYIRTWSESILSYLSKEQLEYIAQISDSHQWDTSDVYYIKSYAREELISLKYLMILIRLADLLDLTEERIDYYLLKQNRSGMSVISRYHWISHLITECFHFDADYNLNPKDSGSRHIEEAIHLDIHINSNLLTACNNKGKSCKNWNCAIAKLKSAEGEIRDCLHFTFSATKGLNCELQTSSGADKCPFLCLWMTDKHGWLLEELYVLENYLNAVNSELIKTTIDVRFFFKNPSSFDLEFIDDVKKHLKLS